MIFFSTGMEIGGLVVILFLSVMDILFFLMDWWTWTWALVRDVCISIRGECWFEGGEEIEMCDG